MSSTNMICTVALAPILGIVFDVVAVVIVAIIAAAVVLNFGRRDFKVHIYACD